MKLFSNIYVAICTFILSIIILTISVFNFQIGKVSDDDTLKKIVIPLLFFLLHSAKYLHQKQ